MGVSIECYRLRIGYQPRYKVNLKYKVDNTIYNSVPSLKYLLALSLLSLGPTNYSSHFIVNENLVTSSWQQGLLGLNAEANNKICHILNGNKNQKRY